MVYLRPETAQGMFVNFALVQQTSRKKIPFGIAQIGKSFRNEITPGNFIFRTREFEQMEMEFFVEPGTDDEWFEYWINERMQWYVDLGIRKEKLRLRPHEPDELAHYAKAASDVEYEFPFGWQEVEGIANRTDFDLKAHQEASGEDLTYFDQEKDERYLPYVVEPAAGVDRVLLTALVDAYREEEAPTAKGGTEKRTYLALHRDLAPTKVAVLPLSRNEQLTPDARGVFDLVKQAWMCDFDDAGSIGRRYRRQDEVGHAVLRDRGLRHARGPPGHRPRTRLDDPGPDPGREPRGLPRRTPLDERGEAGGWGAQGASADARAVAPRGRAG